MRKNISKVIEAFKAGREAIGDSKRSCSTDGTTVYSYRMPIARRVSGGAIVIVAYDDAPTPTTRSQVRALQIAFEDAREASAAQLAPGYVFRDLSGETGYIETRSNKRRYGVAR